MTLRAQIEALRDKAYHDAKLCPAKAKARSILNAIGDTYDGVLTLLAGVPAQRTDEHEQELATRHGEPEVGPPAVVPRPALEALVAKWEKAAAKGKHDSRVPNRIESVIGMCKMTLGLCAKELAELAESAVVVPVGRQEEKDQDLTTRVGESGRAESHIPQRRDE